MDPPSFTRNLCKRKLEITDDPESLNDLHKMIEEKANLIDQRLEKKHKHEE